MAEFNNTNLADFSGVWVFCEQRQGELQPTVLELISEARKLADDMGVEATIRHWQPTPPTHTQRLSATSSWRRSLRSC